MKILAVLLVIVVVAVFVLGQFVVAASDLKPRLVVFTAKWCGACKAVKPTIDAIEAKGYQVTRYDADEQPDILKKYRVKSLPTFIIYTGDRVERTNYIEVVRAWFE
jgi:thioredoxin 1